MATQEQVAARATVQARAEEPLRRFLNWGSIGRYIGVIAVVLVAIGPFYWTIITSIKAGLELNSSPPTIIPRSFSLDSYRTVLSNFDTDPFFVRSLLNSAIIAGVTTVLCLLFGSLCAYAIARMSFRGKAGVLGTVLAVNMFPQIALVGPLFVFFIGPLYIYNTYAAVIIPNLVTTLPLTVWFLTSFFRDLPPDLEEAALVDGSTRLGALWRVVLPLTAPGVFAAAILSFISAWNDFLFGLTLTADQTARPVTVAISRFNGEHTIPWGEIAAAGVVVTIPLVIMVLIFQKRIVSGLTAGAVKG